MWQLLISAMFSVQVVISLPNKGAFTSSVNIEKLYTMEDEMLALTDVILNLEHKIHGDEDVHGIYNISEIVTSVKEIHRDVVTNKRLATYITHPVNMFHLTKRLARSWTKVISVLESSKSCAKAMRVKIENMADNLPTGKDVQQISHGILRLQAMYNISAVDVMSGHIFDTSSHSPFSLDDAFDMARIAYETDYFFLAIDWLKIVTSKYDADVTSFNVTNAMNLLSSAYYKLQQPSKALSTLEKVLQIDPNNQVAKRNKRFINMKVKEGMLDKDVKFQIFKTKKDRLLQKYCGVKNHILSRWDCSVGCTKEGSIVIQESPRQQRLYCTYTAWRNSTLFDRPNIKTEIISFKPFIVIYHGFTTESQRKAITHMGYEQMFNVMSKHRYSNPEGMNGLAVDDRTYWQWVPSLKRALENIDNAQRRPEPSQFVVRNIGLEGYENTPLEQTERTRLGTYLVFLTEPKYSSGGIVFPKLGIKVAPCKGDVLFYDRKVHRQTTICPLVSDSIWVGVYPLHEPMYSDKSFSDNLIRPKPT